MKYLIFIAVGLLFGCSKETICPNEENPIVLEQYIYGDVKANSGAVFILYENRGDGFKPTKELYYSNLPLNVYFFDDIEHPFYFYVKLYNSSVLLEDSHLKGNIGIRVKYGQNQLIDLNCDSTTFSIEHTSLIH